MISLLRQRRSDPSDAAVIPPYGGALHESLRPWRWGLMLGLAAFFIVYGFFFALTAPSLIVPMSAPLGVLGLLSIWALPDMKRAPTAVMTALFMAFVVCLFCWPNYLAVALPGLPWITLVRITGIPMALVLLVCLSISKEFRAQLHEAVNATPLVWKCLVGFAIVQLATVAFSDEIGASLQKFIIFQIHWTAIFFASCFAFLKKDRSSLYIYIIICIALVISLIGIAESVERKVLWRDHIPALLKIDDAETILKASMRAGSSMYRVKSIFTTPLGLAEFLALVAPFSLHIAMGPYNFFMRLAAAVALALAVHVITLTDSRLGIAGLMVGALVYLLAWSLLKWRQRREAMMPVAILLAYPALFCGAVAATFFVQRLNRMVWGSGQHQASSNAREAQIDRGIPIILQQPWGHGPGQGASALGYYSHSFLTIDNYYLAVALEYGIIGFALYYGMILAAIWACISTMIKYKISDSRDFMLLVPITATLVAFVVIKSVFSQQDNHPLIFLLLGMATALIYQIHRSAPRVVRSVSAARQGSTTRGSLRGTAKPVV